MTKREQIISAIETKLKTLSTVPDSKVYRSRQDPYAAKFFPYITIEPDLDSFDQTVSSFTDSELDLKISIFQSGQVPDKAADPILEEVWNKMLSDLSLGGLAQDLRFRNLQFELGQGEKPFVNATYGLVVKFRI